MCQNKSVRTYDIVCFHEHGWRGTNHCESSDGTPTSPITKPVHALLAIFDLDLVAKHGFCAGSKFSDVKYI